MGEHIALVKSQSTAKTGFAKAAEVNERDEGFKIAELISAAPEMYAALEGLIKNWEDGNYRHLTTPNSYAAFVVAKGALRKAKPQ